MKPGRQLTRAFLVEVPASNLIEFEVILKHMYCVVCKYDNREINSTNYLGSGCLKVDSHQSVAVFLLLSQSFINCYL